MSVSLKEILKCRYERVRTQDAVFVKLSSRVVHQFSCAVSWGFSVCTRSKHAIANALLAKTLPWHFPYFFKGDSGMADLEVPQVNSIIFFPLSFFWASQSLQASTSFFSVIFCLKATEIRKNRAS